jgi:hypothetical protein
MAQNDCHSLIVAKMEVCLKGAFCLPLELEMLQRYHLQAA